MNAPLVYHNGRFIPQAEAHLALNDAGLVFGATVTDFCRTFHHRLFRLADHLARFRAGCQYLEITLSCSDEQLARAAEELVKHNAQLLQAGQELALILLATPGPIGYYLGEPGGTAEPTLILHTFPLPFRRYAPWFREGVRLVVPSVRHVPPASIDPRLKHRSRLHWWLAGREAERREAGTYALLVDQDGHVTETAAANFLIVRRGTVLTPPRTSVLDGISLRVTEELCGQLAIPFAEAPLPVQDCERADEAFLTGTAFCLAGVRSVNGMSLPWPGPVTEALAAAWGRLAGLDYRAQILAGQ
jgi:branched-chain amino acid aminotransferase